MAVRVDGRVLAEAIYAELRELPTPTQFLAGIVSGNDAAGESFQKIKQRAAQQLGIDYRIYVADEPATNDAWRRMVRDVARHATCGGAIVQLPLPAHLNPRYVCNAIPAHKDPDALSERSVDSSITSPAVATLETILRDRNVSLATSVVAVVGLGRLVGQPIANYLNGKTSELLLLDIGFDVAALKRADIVVTATGAFNLTPAMLKPGCGVVDFGYRLENGTLRGDLDLSDASAAEKLGFYTPTPGGTGPLLVAHLLRNFYLLNA